MTFSAQTAYFLSTPPHDQTMGASHAPLYTCRTGQGWHGIICAVAGLAAFLGDMHTHGNGRIRGFLRGLLRLCFIMPCLWILMNAAFVLGPAMGVPS